MYINRPVDADAVQALWNEPCLAAAVRRLHRVIVATYDDALRLHGLTVAQLDLLMSLLTAESAVRPIDLARDLRMDRSTLSRNLDRLQARGLVASTPGRNGRESQVVVTPDGKRAAEAAAHAWHAAQQQTKNRLGETGVAALDTLTRLLDTEEQ